MNILNLINYNRIKSAFFLILLFVSVNYQSQSDLIRVKSSETKITDTILPILSEPSFTKAYVDFDYFEKVSASAKKHRSTRLIDFNMFTSYSKEENTIILDTRSKRMYDKMHIKGAVHINFSDFTQAYLTEIIPDTNTRILIYCNNNFLQEDAFLESFASKEYTPPTAEELLMTVNTLALNIPTYINLYGYNYKNVFELSELVSSSHKLLEIEGMDAHKVN
jgi:hypothetical protein